jgi:membrane-bound serine protease (ClpP class)
MFQYYCVYTGTKQTIRCASEANMARFFLILLASLFIVPSVYCQNTVHVICINGSINPASSRYIQKSIATAEQVNAEAIIVELNTPGGLLQSTREIVSAFFNSSVPVVVYVAPQGGQAASAGAFITMAGHIAAMAPGTNIGAAHPVTPGAENVDDSANISMTKATNDAAAFARSIAKRHGRNAAWAEDAVRNSVSVTDTEALELNIIDLIVPDIAALLDTINGMEVQTSSGMKVLETSNVTVERFEMSFQIELLDILSNPNIAYILMMLGIYGLFFELYNPGSIFPGVVGAICLVLGFYSLNTLPLNYAGVALILIGVVLFLMEIKIVSHGLLSIGGIISVFLGSVMLIDTPEGIEVVDISMNVIIAVTFVSSAFFLFVVTKGLRAMKPEPVTGLEGMVGETGTVINNLSPEGSIKVRGEYWKAITEGPHISAGTAVRIKRIDDLVAIVEELPIAD